MLLNHIKVYVQMLKIIAYFITYVKADLPKMLHLK